MARIRERQAGFWTIGRVSLDVHEDDDLDERRLVAWITQARDLPGESV